MTDRRKARTWAEIDLGAMAHNYRALKALTPAGCGFLGLVKADAYGHGAVPVAEKLQELGADMLAVACAAEGEELRRGGIVLPILCLGQTDPALAQDPAGLEHHPDCGGSGVRPGPVPSGAGRRKEAARPPEGGHWYGTGWGFSGGMERTVPPWRR